MKNIIANIVRGKSLTYLAAAFAALATGSAWAADNNWTGAAGDNLFKTDGNWSTGSRPASDTLYFDSNNFDANFTANEIVFDDAYVNNGSFTIQRVGTSESPLVLRATAPSYGLTGGSASADSYIGKNYGSAYLVVSNGTWNTGSTARNMTIGSNNKSWLKLIDVQSFTVNQLNMHNGSTVIIEDSTLATSQVLKDNVAVNNILMFEGGTLRATRNEASAFIQNAGYLKVAIGEKGGTIDNGGYDITMGKLLGDVDGTGPLHLTGAGTTTLGNTLVKNGKIVVDGGTVSASALHIGEASGNDGYVEVNGGTLSIPNNIYMGYGNNSTGTLTINGGMVEVDSSKQLLSANGTGSHGTINLNGGILRTQRIAYQYASSICTINFNGGTLQANADSNNDFIKNGTTVNVSAGGTIDNGGFAITIPAALSGSGSLTFKGSGTTTLSGSVSSYSGATRVVAGSTPCVSKDIATKLLSNGLVLAGAPEQGTPYTILTSSSAGDDWNSLSLSNVTCPVATAISTKIGDDGKSIVVTVTALKSGNVWTGAKNSNMSDADNWLEGVVPGAGADIDLSAATIVNADLDRTFGTVTMGAGVVTFTGDKMKAESFTDTSKIAVGANSTVTVDGNLEFGTNVMSWVCSDVAEGGKFVVAEKIIATSAQTGKLYAHHGTALGWVSAKGLVNNAAGDNFKLVQDTGDYSANWLIGEDGISGTGRFVAGHSNGGTATIKATADFSVSADIVQYHNLTLVPDGHVITLGTNVAVRSGGILGGGANGLTTVTGPGKVVVNYNVTNLTSYVASQPNAFTVADGGTLAIVAGANPSISADDNGKLTVNDGATLVLTADSNTFTPLTNALNLPTEGTATIRIDGARLKSGDHTILSNVTAGATANVTLDMTSAALDGRKRASLAVNGSNLVLNIEPSAMILIVR